jgi:hypothetical protein
MSKVWFVTGSASGLGRENMVSAEGIEPSTY